MTNEEIIDKIIKPLTKPSYSSPFNFDEQCKQELFSESEKALNLARQDERAKVMAEMKEVMDKLCPLANID